VPALLPGLGLLPLVKDIDRTWQRRHWKALRKAGLPSIPSALALMFAKPTLMSFAQNGTSPQRITSKLRSPAVGSKRTTGSGPVGAMLQLGAMFGVGRSGGTEKTSLISLTSEERRTRPHMVASIAGPGRGPSSYHRNGKVPFKYSFPVPQERQSAIDGELAAARRYAAALVERLWRWWRGAFFTGAEFRAACCTIRVSTLLNSFRTSEHQDIFDGGYPLVEGWAPGRGQAIEDGLALGRRRSVVDGNGFRVGHGLLVPSYCTS